MKKKSEDLMDNNLSIIIPAAGYCRKMGDLHKATLRLPDGKILIQRQIDLLKMFFPKADLTVVVGYKSQKLIDVLPNKIRIVENENSLNTSIARSILLGLRVNINPKVLIINGDIVFNKSVLNNINTNKSSVITGNHLNGNVGVTSNNNSVEHIDFGIKKNKWLNMFTLTGLELTEFKRIACAKNGDKLLSWEIINKIIDNGGIFNLCKSEGSVLQIDQTKDIKKIDKVML